MLANYSICEDNESQNWFGTLLMLKNVKVDEFL